MTGKIDPCIRTFQTLKSYLYQNTAKSIRMLRIAIAILFQFAMLTAQAYEPRDLLQKKATVEQLKSLLLPKNEWIKYPAYSNRAGWDALTGSLKEALIKDGEASLNYTWRVVKATDYLAYERTGSRVAMEGPFGANCTALSKLLFAELAEGKGRFMDQIIDGTWQLCEMSSWVLSAHLGVQQSKRSLPDHREQIIDLTAGDVGSLLSWTWYFFRDEFNKVNPIITAKVHSNIEQRILVPYMTRSDYWWQGYEKGRLVNNWNPWCNFNMLTCYLLLEDDPAKQATAVHKTMESVDQFINYVKEDGACEEGPSYWGHAAGKLYDYLQLLHDATGGRLTIFQEPMIRNMGEYIARSYVGDGWVVNFADASAKGGGEPGLIYRYGKAVNSQEMQAFAAWLSQTDKTKTDINAGRDFYRTLGNLQSWKELAGTTPALPNARYSWYPKTEFCYLSNNNGLFFAAKAGFNNESHNHNDVGTFSLYVNKTPMFIDAGVGTYTRQTFSKERYSIWTMQSDYHNLPLINGASQQFGAQYKATEVQFDENRNRFSLNMAGAYGKDAAVKHWKRVYTLSTDKLVIEDAFGLEATKAPNKLHFLTWAMPTLQGPGTVVLNKNGNSVQLQYDAGVFQPSVDTIPQTDPRLSRVWGDAIYRLVLTARKQQQKGFYRIVISKK